MPPSSCEYWNKIFYVIVFLCNPCREYSGGSWQGLVPCNSSTKNNKVTIMRICKPGLLLLALAAFSINSQAQDFAVNAGAGATFYQLDFPRNSPPVLDSAVGL